MAIVASIQMSRGAGGGGGRGEAREGKFGANKGSRSDTLGTGRQAGRLSPSLS